MRFRSVLFTPGTRPDRIEKAVRGRAADIVVADLEDGVAPRDKIEARIAVRNALLTTRDPSLDVVRAVRINAWPSALAEEDLDVVLTAAPALLVVPKAEDPMAIQVLDARIAEAEEAAGIEAGDIGLLLIVETAAGVLCVRELASCCDRVRAIAIGAEDLAADAGMRRTRDNQEVLAARQSVVLAARAAGVDPIDMITADLGDLERCAAEAREARSFGFSGKMCIHPAQVQAVHAAFRPTADEWAWAERVVAAARHAGAEAGGVVVVDGRMVDVPLVRQAHRILQDAP
jgi:citrate lyase subunit beta/citryl-CoA lyase